MSTNTKENKGEHITTVYQNLGFIVKLKIRNSTIISA
jgi:hypothetical protein